MTRSIAFISGKGGVGKTTATINVGQALIALGRKVVLLDSNLVTPNVGIYLGLMNPEGTLNRFLRKEKSLKEITYLHESGLSIIPASPSYQEYLKTNPQNMGKIFDHLQNTVEYVLVDAPSGLGFEVSEVLKHTDEAVIIVTPTLSSVMEGLKTIEVAQQNNNSIAGVIVNMSHRGRHELKAEEMEQILGYPIIANVKDDRKIRKSLHRQLPLNYSYPRCRSAREFKKVAEFLNLEKVSKS